MIWALIIVGAVVVGVAVHSVLRLMGKDRDGLFPKNHLKQMRREDGGLGPIARRDRLQ